MTQKQAGGRKGESIDSAKHLMSFKSQVAHGLKWQMINIVGSKLLSLVVFTTLARLLDPAAFGLVALVGVYLFFTSLVADQGITPALIQRQNPKPEHIDAAFWFNVGCNGILCLGTIALAGPISTLFGEPRLASLLRWSSLGLVIEAASAIHGTLFIKAMDFRRPAIRMMIANVTGGVVGVGMAFAGCGVWALVGQQLSSALAGAIFLWAASPYRPAFRLSLPHLRDLLGVSSSVFATSLLWFVSSRLDQIVIGRFAGVPALGFYVIAGKLPDLATTLTQQPVAQVSLSAFSQIQNDHAQMRQVIYRGMKLNAFVSFAVFVGLATVASDLVPFLFGSKWVAASELCSLLSLYALIRALQIFSYPALLASGGVGKYVILNVAHTIGVLIACVVGIQFGVRSLVLGLILNDLIMAFPGLRFLRHRIGLNLSSYCEPCLAPACASILMAAFVWLTGSSLPLDTPTVLRLVCKIFVGAISYIGFMLVFKRETVIDLIDILRHALGRRLHASVAVPSVVIH